MGPPHLHIGIDFFMELSRPDKLQGKHQTRLEEFRMLTEFTSMNDFGDIVSYFQVKKSYAVSGQAAKSNVCLISNSMAAFPWSAHWQEQPNAIRTGSQEAEVQLGKYTLADLQRVTVTAFNEQGAEMIHGAPPLPGLERQTQAALGARQECRSSEP
ncbi:unnamed protein product [Prorocentrum cordatum]|uniref:Uncharacterized protein n=1 Tax=Prorocentrum cordatum TaxID=2364126 RepID=A0ABN9X2G1_9DINO|nr:unnamed protein product [Polarella glacialis]